MQFERASKDKIKVVPSHEGGYFEENGHQWGFLWLDSRIINPKPSSLFNIDEDGNIKRNSNDVWLENPGASNVYSFREFKPLVEYVVVDDPLSS